jgi:hypothetical protein
METEVLAATTQSPMVKDQETTVDEAAFTQATDELIALYRNVERRTLDLPAVSFRPLVIGVWQSLKFSFFLYVGLLLIIPVNLVILLRNLFPGHWNYRPFFLRQLLYVWLWVWRGEAPVVPIVFVRPMFDIFLRRHFARRLRRLQSEISTLESISEAARAALLARLDAALKRWSFPNFGTIFLTVLLPGVIALPSYAKQLTDFLGYFGISVPMDAIDSTFTSYVQPELLKLLAIFGCTYLFAVPCTAFLAKRGLFIGADTKFIWFPGGREGDGIYSKEREILGGVGLRISETPTDLWIASPTILFTSLYLWNYLNSDYYAAAMRLPLAVQMQVMNVPSYYREAVVFQAVEKAQLFGSIATIVLYCASTALLLLAAFRRAKTGRH